MLDNGEEQDPDPLDQAGKNEDMLLGGAGQQQPAPNNATAVCDKVLQALND